jgi:hypothetical protein
MHGSSAMSKLTDAARDQACVRCNAEDGTIVSCHYSGPWQHRFGKGRNIKGNDLVAADLCSGCHAYFDEYQGVPVGDELAAIKRSDEFQACCLLTVIRRLQQGVIRV